VAASIHPSAIVHPGAVLGEDVVIGPHCLIEDNVILGDRTRIDGFALIKSNVRMGADNRVHSHACVGGEPQDLKYKGEETWVEIGDRNTIREFVTIHRGTVGGGGRTIVGSDCLLMAYVHLAHDCHLGDRVILANAVMLGGHVTLGTGASIGGMTGVAQFVRIGEYAFLGAMSGLGMDLPPYMLAAGSRASLHSLNLVALRRLGISKEAFGALNLSYKRIFRSEIPRADALASVEAEFGHIPEIAKILEFIRNSKRGIVTPEKGVENGSEPVDFTN